MKIGFLITYFYPRLGGAESNCYYLARELAKKHEVHIFCSGERESEEIIENMHIHRSKEILRLTYYLGFYPSITKKIRKYDLDILHIHGFGFAQHDWAIRNLKDVNPRIKIICTPHGPFMALKKYNLLISLLKKIYMPLLKKSLLNYDAIIQVNPYQDKWLCKDYGVKKNKIYLLPNGIPSNLFEKIPSAYLDSLIEKYHLRNKFVISYLGRIQKYKGLDQVIEIMPKIKDKFKNVVFLAIGKNADDLDRLKGIAKELRLEKDVIFTGEVSEKEKIGLLELSQIFIFPSEWEAFGISTLEAMARCNAVISSKTEGGLYLVEKDNGSLFDYGNKKQLLHSLIKMIKDKRKLRRIQAKNIQKAKGLLWEDLALKLEKIYQKA